MKLFLRILIFSWLFIFFHSFLFAQSECNLGIDANNDGRVDCSADAGCQYPATTELGCNCADGIDNDGDGMIDTLDPNCASFYGLEFVGDSESCDGFDSGSGDGTGVFDFLGVPLETSQNTVDTQSKVAVGDVNCDGIPDVIATSKFNQEIRVIATTDGQPGNKDVGDIIQDFKLTGQGASIFPNSDKGKFFFELEILIADIDGQCPVEIFTIASSRSGNGNNEPTQYYLLGFRANPTPSTGTLVPLFDAIPLGPDRPGSLGIADFDCDGEAEIFIKDQIYDAATGELLADGNLGNWDTDVNSGPIAADIIAGGTLEIVAGNILFSVPTLSDGSTQTMTVLQDMNDIDPSIQFFPKTIFDGSEYGTTNWSSTSVADVNNDGHLDIVMSGALNANDGPTAVFFWDVFNGTVDVFLPPDPDFADGWPWGTSRVNLGDIDGDGKLELTFIAGNQLFALEEVNGELVQKWVRTINDSKSGIVSTTVYDFDNDGNPEVVYRDSQELVVIDGATGQSVIWSVPCQSHTSMEGPVIADVNGDGTTDLCVSCATANFDINDPIQQQALGQMECYFSSENDWLPTRDVWNQQGYAAVNIADDLSVPCPAFDMMAEFIGDCDNDGVDEINRPLNTFMNQVPTFGQDGCPFFPAPDISFVGNDPTLEPGDPGYVDPSDPDYFPAIEFTRPICGDLGIAVGFNIINSGSLAITSNLNISFWEGDPTVAVDPELNQPAQLLHTTILALAGMQVGDTVSQGGIVFDYSGTVSTIYIVLNDDGTQFPIDLTDNEFDECFIDNNIYAFPISPDPFVVTIEKISDNTNCDAGVSGVDSGELRAVVTRNGVEVTDFSNFAFQWYDGSDETAPLLPNAQGGTSDQAFNLGIGDYTLIVTNTEKGCASLPITETIIQTATTPVATIQVVSNQTICSPPNGELEVTVDGDLTGVTFDWRDEFGTPLGITGPVASDLTEGGYAVIVSRNGCPLQLDANITGPLVPDITASVTQNIISCADINSGAVTSQVFLSGVLQDPNLYDFNWYFYDIATSTLGSALPPENGTGPSRTGLAAGDYAVFATQLSTDCETTIPAIVSVTDSRQYPTVVITEVAPQTSCDPSNPNGILGITITNPDGTAGNPADYAIDWFRGSNTLDANLHTNTNADDTQALGVEGGGIPYTVRITDVNGCIALDELPITEDINVPVATLTKISDNNICDETLASSSFNGEIELSVTFDGVTVNLPDPLYEITWYSGSTTASPEITVADNTLPNLSGLDGGQQYTAVITRTDLFCTSVPVTVNVLNIQAPPLFNFEMVPSTTCTGPGNAMVQIDDIEGNATPEIDNASATGYTVNWYLNGSGTPLQVDGQSLGAPGSGNTLNVGDEILIEVINNETGCSTTQLTVIGDNSELPTFTFTTDPNSVCDENLASLDFTGVIDITLDTYTNDPGPDGNPDTYTYAINGPVNTSNNTGLFENLPDGNYTVTVTNDDLGCTSDPVPVVVNDIQVPPVIDFTMNPSTRCVAPFNGSVTLNMIDGVAVNFSTHTVNWYEGNALKATPDGTNLLTYFGSGMAPGQEVLLQVIDNATGCSTTQLSTITDASEKPTFTFNTQPNSVCDETLASLQFTGEIDITLDTYNNDPGVDGVPDTYTYSIESTTTGVLTNNTGLFENLPDETYEVIVTNNDLGCASDPVPVIVQDIQIPPVFVYTMNPSTTCTGDGNGSVVIDEIEGNTTPLIDNTSNIGYTVNWYLNGSGTPAQMDGSVYGDNESLALNDVILIEVINNETGCITTQQTTITNAAEKPTFTFLSSPNEVCDESLGGVTRTYTGGIEITLNAYNPDPTFANEYVYAFDGPEPGAGDLITQSTNDMADAHILEEAQDGQYQVTVTNVELGCTSDPVPVNVAFSPSAPDVFEILTPSTNCPPVGNPNGSIEINLIDGAAFDPALHTINWYDGNSVTATPDETGAFYTDIAGDAQYTVQVINIETGCSTVETYTLQNNQQVPLANLVNSQDNTICSPSLTNPLVEFNGVIEVEIDDPNGLPAHTYTVTWYNGDEVTDPEVLTDFPNAVITNDFAISPMTSTVSGIPGGTYTFVIANNELGCESAPRQVTIVNTTDLPPVTIDIDNDQTSCGAPNGQLTVQDPGASTYNYEWFVGSGTGTPFVDGVNGTISNGDRTISDLAGNERYTVRITDLQTGCQDISEQLLPETIILPLAIEVGKNPNSTCDIVNLAPTGNLEISIEDGVGNPIVFPTSDYDVLWYEGETPSGTETRVDGDALTAGSPTIDNLDDGKYTIVVQNLTTECTSLPITVEIIDEIIPPTILTSFTEQTSCDEFSPNGEMVVEVTGPAAIAAHTFTVTWYNGATIAGTEIIENTGVPLNTPITDDGAGYPLGDYTLLVYDELTGCTTQETIALPQNIVNPVVSVNPTDHTDCTFDGFLTPTLVQGANVEYTFNWYAGELATGTPIYSVTTLFDDGAGPNVDDGLEILSQANKGTLTNLYAGFYTLEVIDTENSCTVNTVTSRILPNEPQLNIKFKPIFLPSDCADAVGVLTAYIDLDDDDVIDAGETQYTDFTFTWYEGLPTDPEPNFIENTVDSYFTGSALMVDLNDRYTSGVAGGTQDGDYFIQETATTGATLYDQFSGTYTVVIEDLTGSGCKEYSSVFLPFVDAQVTTLVRKKDDTDCTTDNGEIEVIVNEADGSLANQSLYPVVLFNSQNPNIDNYIDAIEDPSAVDSIQRMEYISDFSTDVDGWDNNFTRVAFDPNQDNVEGSGINDALKIYMTGNGSHIVNLNHLVVGHNVTIEFDYYIPSTNTSLDGFNIVLQPFGAGLQIRSDIGNVVFDSWETITFSYLVGGDRERLQFTDGASNSFNTASDPNDDVIYIKNYTVKDNTIPTTTFSNLAPGNYSVVSFQDFGSGCPSELLSVTIEEAARPPMVTPTITHDTWCDNTGQIGDGSITVSADIDPIDIASVDNGPAGQPQNTVPFPRTYSFLWSTADGSPTANGATTATIEDLAPGEYTVTVTDTDTNCETVITYEIVDQDVDPALATFALAPSDRCTPNENGAIEIDVSNIAPATLNPDDPELGDYEIVLLIEDDVTKVLTDVTGTVTVDNTGDPIIRYEDLVPGTYYVTIENLNPLLPGFGCVSPPIQAGVIEDISTDPVLTDDITVDNSCDPNSSGEIRILADDGAPTPGIYIYEWYIGNSTDAGDLFINGTHGELYLPGENHPIHGVLADNESYISNVDHGDYTVRVYDPVSNCFTTSLFTVDYEPLIPEITVVPVAQTFCDATANGQVNLTGVNVDAIGDYEYYLYDGIDDYNTDTRLSTDSDFDGVVSFQNLDAGTYYVVANKVSGASGGLGCLSSPVSAVIADETIQPNITVVPSFNTACDGNFEGAISINVSTSGGPGDDINNPVYTYTITDALGNPIVGGPFTGNGNALDANNDGFDDDGDNDIISGLVDDIYTVVALNGITGCTVTGSATISKVEEPIIIQTVVPTNQTTCDETIAGGIAEVTSITPFNGTIGVDLLTTEYDFTWYRGELGESFADVSADIANNLGVNDVIIEDLSEGTYYVVATRMPGISPGSGCESPPFRVDIIDESVPPTFTVTAFANTSCDPGSGEGSLLIENVLGGIGGGIDSDFDIEIVGANFGVVLAQTNESLLPSGDFPYTHSNLEEDIYTITIFDNNTGCELVQQREILFSLQPVIVTEAEATDQTTCDPTLPLVGGGTGGGTVTLNSVSPAPTGPNTILDEYEIFWYQGALGDDFATAQTNPILATDQPSVDNLSEGTYYVTVTRRSGFPPGAGCSSDPYRVDVFDVSVPPTFTATAFAETSCDGSGEGSLVIDNIVGGLPESVEYNIIIDRVEEDGTFSGNVSTTNNYDFGADGPFTETGLGVGYYRTTIEDIATGCTQVQTRQITLSQQPIIITSASKIDQTTCNVAISGGSVTLNSVTPFNGSPNISDEYEIFWFQGALGADFTTAQGNQIAVDVETVPNLAEGTYYVQVRRRVGQVPGAGCESAPFRLDVFDNSTDPIIQLRTETDTSCDGPGEGEIAITLIDGVGPFDLTISDTDPGTADIIELSIALPYTASTLPEDDYIITVFDIGTGCDVMQTAEILLSQQPIIITSASATDQTVCSPVNGSVTVLDVTPAPTGVNTIDDEYTFEWYENTLGGSFATSTIRPETSVSIAGLPEGTYYVIAVRGAFSPGAGCQSAPFRVDVQDVSEPPILSFSQPEPDTNCDNDATDGNGAVTVNTNVDIVTWEWFERDLDNDNLFNEAGEDDEPLTAIENNTVRSSEYTGLAPGIYRLRVEDVNGCTSETQVEILNDPTQSTPNVIDVDVLLTTNCFGNGSFQVSEISLGDPNDPASPNASITDSLRLATEFTYDWYLGSPNPVDSIAFEHSSVLDSVAAGTYYVIVTSLITECTSIPKEVVMDEINITQPSLFLSQTVPQLGCKDPYTGELTAVVTEDDPLDTDDLYRFEWRFEGSLTLPSGAIGPNTNANISVLGGLPVGRYDVTVFNDSTGCSATALFIVEDESDRFIPVINTGTQPVTSCTSPNGGIFGKAVPFTDANGVNIYPLLPYDYSIDIYAGNLEGQLDDTSPSGDLASQTGVNAGFNVLVDSVPSGFYTVRIIDNKTGCYSVKADEVLESQTVPVVEVVEDNPLINCDPAEANGQISATADDGRVGGYTFEWYEGNTATGTIISTNNRLIGRGAGEFTVVVTNIASGCSTTATGLITDGTLPSPTPDPELISDRLSCIEPDGKLRVSVDGGAPGYSFEWYDEADGNGLNFSDDAFIINLDIGNYSVIAYDNATGCASEPANIAVGDQRLDPEFSFETEGSKCDEDTGLARIIITNEAVVTSVFWTQLETGAGLGLGSELNFLPPGDYQADVTTFYGCEASGTVNVGTVITNYNLVTSDNDGINDNFQIDCITNFPNNNVKIYNRAGVLVYQIDGYNNEDKSFQGIGEDGVYTIGDELPNGTYFYVIDKGDGSKLISGFLELIR